MKRITCWIVMASCLAGLAVAQKPVPQDPVTPQGQMVDRWLERMSEQHPEKHKQLVALRESDPKAFRSEMKALRRAMKQHEPGGREKKMTQRAAELVEQVHQADPVDREAAVQALREHVTTIFDAGEARKAKQVNQMEWKLEELKKKMKQRQQHRDNIIEQRIGELLTGQDS